MSVKTSLRTWKAHHPSNHRLLMSEITAPTIAQPKGTITNRDKAQLPVIIEKTLEKILVNSEIMPDAPSTAYKNIIHHPLSPEQAKEGLHNAINDEQTKQKQEKKHNIF